MVTHAAPIGANGCCGRRCYRHVGPNEPEFLHFVWFAAAPCPGLPLDFRLDFRLGLPKKGSDYPSEGSDYLPRQTPLEMGFFSRSGASGGPNRRVLTTLSPPARSPIF